MQNSVWPKPELLIQPFSAKAILVYELIQKFIYFPVADAHVHPDAIGCEALWVAVASLVDHDHLLKARMGFRETGRNVLYSQFPAHHIAAQHCASNAKRCVQEITGGASDLLHCLSHLIGMNKVAAAFLWRRTWTLINTRGSWQTMKAWKDIFDGNSSVCVQLARLHLFSLKDNSNHDTRGYLNEPNPA